MSASVGQTDKGQGNTSASTAGVNTGATGSTFWVGIVAAVQPFTSTGSTITGNTVLTIGTLVTGSVNIGSLISGTGVGSNRYVTGFVSAGVWTVTSGANVAAEAINGALPVVSISDTVGGIATGNVYTQIGTGVWDTNAGGRTMYRFYCQNGAGGATHIITGAFQNLATPNMSIFLVECLGCVTTGGEDQQNSGTTGFASSIATGNITLTPPASGEIIISLHSSAVYPTADPVPSGSISAILQQYTDNTSEPGSAVGALAVTAATTYSVTWTDGNANASDMAASIDSFQGLAGPVLYGDGTSASNTVVTTGTNGQAMPAITSGQVLDIVLMAETGSALTDSGPVWVGTSGGSFTNIQTISSTGYIFDHWQCVVTTSVALPVIKTTWSGGTPTKAGIAVVPNNGVLISNPISAGNYNVNHQVTPTGTDGQVSGNTTNPLTTGLLYLMGSYGFSFGQASAPTAGTGFASIATMWASLGSGACLNYETKTLTGAGAVAQATFTPVGGSDSMTVMAVFNSSFVPLMGQACL